MIQKLVGKIWRNIPSFARVALVRATQRKFTVSVGAVVINPKGEILLLDHVLRPASGWGIPGGFVDRHEQAPDALRRELLEEIGLEIEIREVLRIRTTDRHVEILYSAHAENAGNVKSVEIRELRWFRFEQLPPEMSLIHREIIKEVLSKSVKY